jgi:hypothetical protein
MRHARTALAAVLILALGVSAFFVFPSPRTHPLRAGSTSDPGQMIGSVRTTSKRPLSFTLQKRGSQRSTVNRLRCEPQACSLQSVHSLFKFTPPALSDLQ